MLIPRQRSSEITLSGLCKSSATVCVAGFTLIEMLVVITLIALIAGVAMPSVNSILRGSKLTQSAQLVIDQFTLARQTALTKNRSVEVRIYRYGDPETPGEDKNIATSGRYRAIQLFEIADSGTATAMGNLVRLSSSMMFDSGATLSTLIGSAASSPTVPTLTTSGSQTLSVSTMGTNYDSVSFRFNADGSTNLPAASLWFLTLHSLNDKDAQAKPPANFFTLQIEPTNGHIKNFRPSL